VGKPVQGTKRKMEAVQTGGLRSFFV